MYAHVLLRPRQETKNVCMGGVYEVVVVGCLGLPQQALVVTQLQQRPRLCRPCRSVHFMPYFATSYRSTLCGGRALHPAVINTLYLPTLCSAVQPGKRYELYLGEDEQAQQAQRAQQAGRLSLRSGGGGSSSSRGQGKRRHGAAAEGGTEAAGEQQQREEAEGEQEDSEEAGAADEGECVHACKLARRIAARAAKRRRQGKAAGGGPSKQ